MAPGEVRYFKFDMKLEGFELLEVASEVGRNEIQKLRQVPAAATAAKGDREESR